MKLPQHINAYSSGRFFHVFSSVILVLIISLIASILCLPAYSYGEELSALDIMKQVEEKEREKTMSAITKMVLIGNDGQQRNRVMQSYTKRENGVTKKSIFFISPPNVKGAALLTIDYTSKDQEDDQWIYLPALHKIKRISAGNRNGSFMGSDISYGDLTQKSIDLYSYKLLKEQQLGEHMIWVIEAIPKAEETKKLYGYSKSLLLVRQDNFVIVRSVHWLDNNLLKYSEVKTLKQLEGIWVPLEVHAKTVSNGKTIHQTIITSKDVKLNQPVENDIFTKRRLELGL